jgi:hypothetical protein
MAQALVGVETDGKWGPNSWTAAENKGYGHLANVISMTYRVKFSTGTTTTTTTSTEVEDTKIIWDFFVEKLNGNEYGAAAAMGNFSAESACIPYRV